jgi:SAM-dependent methyltransferase
MLKRKLIFRLNRHVIAPWLHMGMRIDQVIPLQELGLDPRLAHEHAPTNDYLELWRLLKEDHVDDRSIVDLGCGSGAALCLFSKMPFSRIWGVELNPNLARTAAANFSKDPRVVIECGDARQFQHRADIVYLFNPFPWMVLEEALRRLTSHGKALRLIYRNPKFLQEIETATHWTCADKRLVDSSTSRYFLATLSGHANSQPAHRHTGTRHQG